MRGFRVDENALDGAADDLMALAPAVPAAHAYVNQWVVLGGLGDSGIFVQATGVLENIRNAVDEELDHLWTLVSASASELRGAAEMYRTTDDAQDAAMDALYEQVVVIERHGGRNAPKAV